MKDAVEIAVAGAADNFLPVGIPVMHLVVALPVRIFLVEPHGAVLFPRRLPVVAVAFCLTNRHIAHHQTATTVGFVAQLLDFFSGKGLAIEKQIHDQQVVVGGANGGNEGRFVSKAFRINEI